MAGEINTGITDLGAFYRGAEQSNALMQSFARRRAGMLITKGDTAGAMGELNNSGQMDVADTIQKAQLSNKSTDLNIQERSNTLDQSKHAFRAKMISDIATQLDNVGTQMGWDKVVPALDHLTPLLQSQGEDAQTIQQIREALMKDPQGTVRAISANAAKNLELTRPKYQTLAPGQSLAEIPRDGVQAPPGPDQAPLSQGQPPAEVQTPEGPDTNVLSSVDPNAVEQVESNHNPNAVGPSNVKGGAALGSMQTQTGTLRDPGYGVTPAKDNSPDEMRRVGRDYLGAMTKHFGSPVLGIIAYNMGPDATKAWINNGADFNKLPKETQQYIGKVALAQSQGQNPDMGESHLATPAPNGTAPTPVPSKGGSGPKIVLQGQPVWRSLTADEQKAYPGAIQINTNGQVKYPPASAVPGIMTMDAKKLAASRYLITGQLPPMGMGGMVERQEILNMSAEMAKAAGQTGAGVVATGSEFKSNAAALTKLTGVRAQVASYEGTVNQSMGLVDQYAKKALANTGFTFTNRAVNWWKNATNNPDMAQLNNAIQTTTNEYAKVISNATGGGVTSDAARSHAEELLNAADSYQSLMAKIDVLKQEMGFRVNSMDNEIAGLGQKMRVPFGQDNQAPAKQRTGTYNPATKKIEWQ